MLDFYYDVIVHGMVCVVNKVALTFAALTIKLRRAAPGHAKRASIPDHLQMQKCRRCAAPKALSLAARVSARQPMRIYLPRPIATSPQTVQDSVSPLLPLRSFHQQVD